MHTWPRKMLAFVRRETVLCAAWALALASMLLMPPDGAYAAYPDWHTLALLFCLMAVTSALRGAGTFSRLAHALLRRTHRTRALEGVLMLLCFFSSMLITNDVALITFVPFAIEVLLLAGMKKRIPFLVVLLTLAANLGSMATPIGNPQNLYLYARYGLSARDFLVQIGPFALVSLALLGAALLFSPSRPLDTAALRAEEPRLPGARRVEITAFVLLALCLLTVARIVPLPLTAAAIVAALLAIDRKAFARVDYALLFTFLGFFIFIGNMGRVDAFSQLLSRLLIGREVEVSILLSQIISNVPAALLLSGFTESGASLLIGTNLGGLGTLIASMASLISYKAIARALPTEKGRYFYLFTALNLAFLAALYAVYALLF